MMSSKHHLVHVFGCCVVFLHLPLLFDSASGQDDSTPAPIGQHQIHWCEFNSTVPQSNPDVCRQIRQNTGLNNVVFADLDDCSNYYQCTGNRLHHRQCASGTWFDSRHYYCADQVDAQCLTNCDGFTIAPISSTTTRRKWQTLPRFTRTTLASTRTGATKMAGSISTAGNQAPSYCRRPLPCTPGDKVPDLSRSCKFYFECVVVGESQEWKAKVCPSRIGPTLFDPVSQSCKRAGTVVCPEPCPETTTDQETTPLGATSTSDTVITTHEETTTSVITDSTSRETTTGPQETISSSPQSTSESTSLLTTLFKFSTAQSPQSITEAPSTQGPVTTATMPSSSMCERQLPCTLDENLPDPENCTFYYKCSVVEGSPQLQTHWNHIRCVSKVGHTQFDSISLTCMHVDEDPTCALPCSSTSSSGHFPTKQSSITVRTTEVPQVVSTNFQRSSSPAETDGTSTPKNRPGDATTQTSTSLPTNVPEETTTSKAIQTTTMATTMAFGELSTVSMGESTSLLVNVTDKTFAQSTSKITEHYTTTSGISATQSSVESSRSSEVSAQDTTPSSPVTSLQKETSSSKSTQVLYESSTESPATHPFTSPTNDGASSPTFKSSEDLIELTTIKVPTDDVVGWSTTSALPSTTGDEEVLTSMSATFISSTDSPFTTQFAPSSTTEHDTLTSTSEVVGFTSQGVSDIVETHSTISYVSSTTSLMSSSDDASDSVTLPSTITNKNEGETTEGTTSENAQQESTLTFLPSPTISILSESTAVVATESQTASPIMTNQPSSHTFSLSFVHSTPTIQKPTTTQPSPPIVEASTSAALDIISSAATHSASLSSPTAEMSDHDTTSDEAGPLTTGSTDSPIISSSGQETTDTQSVTTPAVTTAPPAAIVNHTLNLSSSVAYEDQLLALSCSFQLTDSSVLYNIIWFLDGLRIDTQLSPRISVKDTTQGDFRESTISFANAKVYDSGKLECVVRLEDESTSSADYVVTVLGLPHVSVHPRTASVKSGQTVTLICSYSVLQNAHPESRDPAVVIWKKGSSPVESGQVADIKDERGRSELTFTATKDEEYDCFVQNSAGITKSQTAHIHILLTADLFCPAGTDKQGVSWPKTKGGMTSMVDCPKPQIGTARRRCGDTVDEDGSEEEDDEGVAWGRAKYSQCIGQEFIAVLAKFDRLSDGIGVSSDVLNNISQTMKNITSFRLHPGDIMASVDIVTRIEKIHEVYTDIMMSKDEMQAFVDTMSNLLSEQNHKSWKALQDEDSDDTAQTILPLMDAYTSIAVRDIPTKETFMSDNLLLQLESFPKLSARTVSFPRTQALPMSWMMNENDVITLQKEAFDNLPQDLISSSNYSLSSIYFKDVSSILPSKLVGKMEEEGESGSEDDEVVNKLNSRVLSLTLHGLPASTRLQPNVTINLSLTEPYENHTALCAFWNYNLSGRYVGGGWDTEGCHLVSLSDQQVTCQCNHLTNFAILMSPNPVDDEHQFILSIISIVGCVVSIGCMVLTILIYIAMWKHVKSHHAVVLINLCIALIVANIFFVAGVDKTDIPVMCTIIAVVLHYFYLSAFFLMLVEGIELLLYTIYVFHVRRKRETAALIFLAWTLPAVIVGVCLGVTKMKGYGNDHFCWLDIESGLLWAFVGPALLIIFINVIIAIVVMKRLATARVLGTMQKKKHKIRSALRNLLVIMPVMGLAWLFGVFTVNDGLHNHIFQYIFVVANSLQGLFIFIFHALCNKKKKSGTQSSSKTQRSRLKSDASGKSKKSKHSDNSTPSSILDEKAKLMNGNPNRNSLPEYNFLFPQGQPAGNTEVPSVPGTHTIGYDNPTFSTFSGDREHMHSESEDPITKTGMNGNAGSTQELHYVEEVTYNLKPDSPVKSTGGRGAPGGEARSPLTSSSSSNSTTSC